MKSILSAQYTMDNGFLKKIAKSDEETILLRSFLDKHRQRQNKNIVTATKFLNGYEQSVCKELADSEKITDYFFAGGTENAERAAAVFLPSYITEKDEAAGEVMCIIRCTKSIRDELSHRDYLGSLMGLGIERNMVGDIFVHPLGADIVVLKDIAEFICLNLTKAGRKEVKCEELPLSKLIFEEKSGEIQVITAASPRLDAVAAKIWNMSRGDALDMITRGLVFLNDRECKKADKDIGEGDKIAVKGKGRAFVRSFQGQSKKGKLRLEIERQ